MFTVTNIIFFFYLQQSYILYVFLCNILIIVLLFLVRNALKKHQANLEEFKSIYLSLCKKRVIMCLVIIVILILISLGQQMTIGYFEKLKSVQLMYLFFISFLSFLHNLIRYFLEKPTTI